MLNRPNSVLLPAALVLILACSGGGGGDPDAVEPDAHLAIPDLPAFVPPEKNAIVGRVLSPSGQGIAGVKVTSDAGGQGTTNHDGYYALADLPPRDRIVVAFAADGYVPTTRTGAMALDGRLTVNAVLIARTASKPLPEDAPATFGHGTVAVARSAVVGKDGQPATGAIQVRSTPIPTRGQGLVAVPGDFSATTTEGATAQLETFAMADYQLVDEEGRELAIAPGQQADIEMLLPTDTALKEGDTLPAWHFDAASGRWIEEGQGTVVASTQEPGRLAFQVAVGHFSTWNCDKEMQTTCIRGTVRTCDGSPAPMADLMSDGQDYDGTARTATGMDGTFCLLARTNSTVTVSAGLGWNEARLVAVTTVTTGSDPSQCPGPCVQADLTLPCTAQESGVDCDDTWFAGCKSCVRGRVVGPDGKPRAAVLKASSGKASFTVVTDENGEYCAPAALEAPVTITADSAGQAGAVTFTPTQAGACPACGQAPDLELSAAAGDDELDFGDCPSIGNVVLTKVRADGTAPPLARLDRAWATMEQLRQGGWQLVLNFTSSASTGMSGAPVASVRVSMPEPVAAGTRIDIQEDQDATPVRGDAYSAVGTISGLGGDTYQVASGSSPAGRGFVRFDTVPAAPGDRAKGSFELVFDSDCAPKGASLTLAGTFDAEAVVQGFTPPGMDGTDSPAFRAWKCGLFDLFLLAKTIVGIDGAVSLALDGAAIQSESSPLDQARYSWEDDTLELSFYAEDVTFSARVEHPVSGENLVASGALYPGDDCYYDVKAGVVTLDGFTGAEVDRWLTGTFDVQFTKSSFAEGTCPDHQAVGRFGAAVCR